MREVKFRAYSKIDPTEKEEFTLDELMRGHITFSHPEHYNFVQFTGLKDKNETEIYENDIYKLSKNPIEVKWQRTGRFQGYGLGNSSKKEVLGNIYENPELLNY